MVDVRLHVEINLEPRSATATADGLISNAFLEKDELGVFAYKRPGLIQKVSGTGSSQGHYYYNGKLYSWDSGVTATTPHQTVI